MHYIMHYNQTVYALHNMASTVSELFQMAGNVVEQAVEGRCVNDFVQHCLMAGCFLDILQ